MPKASGRVIALPGAELPGLGVAATSFTGNRVLGSRNEIWLLPAYGHNAQPLVLYVKLGLPTRTMLVEALCAQLAHCLQLDCPAPYLVTVNPLHVGRPRGLRVLAFGAEDVSERAMARPLRSTTRLVELLQARRLDDLACVFDEWIGNDVRSPSDVLVSPEARIYLIDHEAALADGMKPGEAKTNWLCGRLLDTLDDRQRADFLRRLRARLASLHRVRLGEPPLAAQYSPDGIAIYRTLLQFLSQRLRHLDRLLSERVMPHQRYIIEIDDEETSAPNAADRTAEF